MFPSSPHSLNLNSIIVVVILLQILPRGGKVVLPGVSSAAEAESLRAEVCHYETFEVNCTQLMKSSLAQHHHHHHHHQRHRHQEANGNKNGDQNVAETSLSHVIMIEKSKYGRMQLGRCATKDYGHVGCHHDVTDHTTSLCSGLEGCRIHVPDEWLKALQPCPKDFASFLEISYKCLPVAVASKANTCSGHIIVDVNRRPIPEGHLASHVTQTTNHGSKNCPWLVRASQGQRLTLSLIELVTSSESPFPAYNLDGSKMADKSYVVIHPTESSDMNCLKYAQIRDLSSSEETTKVCGSKEGRNRVVYTSKGHLVEVTILTQGRDKTAPRFLLHYKAIGCAMLTAPSNGWLEQDGKDVMVSGCNSTNEKRVHKCHGNQWSNPDVITCPEAGGTSRSYSWSTNNEEWSSPLGILFVSAIGVSLGLVIGVSLLFVVVVCLKRYRSPAPAIGRNPAVAYDPANQMEDIYQHHHQLGQSQVGHRHQFQPLGQSGYPTQDSNLILRAGGQDSTTKLTSPPQKIEIIPLQTPMTYGALWPPGENSLLDVHTRISDMSSSSHALPSTNHKPLLLGHCNCDLDVIATTDAVSRRHFEKGHPCWSSNECSYDYPEVVSTTKKPLSEMSGFDLSNQSVRLQ